MSAKAPLRSALRSPQKKTPQDLVEKLEINSTKTALVYRGDQDTNVNRPSEVPKPKRAQGKLLKGLDHLDPKDMAKTLLLKKFSLEKVQNDLNRDTSSSKPKQQFEGYIPKSVPKEIEANKAETKAASLKLARSVCFKSRTPTPELQIVKGSTLGKRKSNAYLSLVRKQLEKIDAERDIPNIPVGRKQGKVKNRRTFANGRVNGGESSNGLPHATNSHPGIVANSNGLSSSSSTDQSPVVNSNGVLEVMGNPQAAVSDSHGMEDPNDIQAILGDLCKNLEIPEVDVNEFECGFSLDDMNVLFEDGSSQASSQEADAALANFDLDIFT